MLDALPCTYVGLELFRFADGRSFASPIILLRAVAAMAFALWACDAQAAVMLLGVEVRAASDAPVDESHPLPARDFDAGGSWDGDISASAEELLSDDDQATPDPNRDFIAWAALTTGCGTKAPSSAGNPTMFLAGPMLTSDKRSPPVSSAFTRWREMVPRFPQPPISAFFRPPKAI